MRSHRRGGPSPRAGHRRQNAVFQPPSKHCANRRIVALPTVRYNTSPKTVHQPGCPMGWLLTTILLLSQGAAASPEGVVPSRDLDLPPIIVQAVDPMNFDLLDVRDEMREDP